MYSPRKESSSSSSSSSDMQEEDMMPSLSLSLSPSLSPCVYLLEANELGEQGDVDSSMSCINEAANLKVREMR
jgi:hypothetical protein